MPTQDCRQPNDKKASSTLMPAQWTIHDVGEIWVADGHDCGLPQQRIFRKSAQLPPDDSLAWWLNGESPLRWSPFEMSMEERCPPVATPDALASRYYPYLETTSMVDLLPLGWWLTSQSNSETIVFAFVEWDGVLTLDFIWHTSLCLTCVTQRRIQSIARCTRH